MKRIQYLLHQQINKTKWDDCVSNAANGLLYACSGYLDSMVQQWNALVLNDYEMVMPLPCRKKAGISYLFQPSITPALGIFGNGITGEIGIEFLNSIPKQFKLWDLSFNSSNKIVYTGGTIVARNNFVLNLNDSYNQLRQNYSENIQRNIAKAVKSGCVVKKDISFDDVAAICKREFPKFTQVEDGLFEMLHKVYKTYKADAKMYGVFSNEGTLLASAIFLFFKTGLTIGW